MVAAMRGVAGPAVLLHGGMFPEVGAAFVGVAVVAQLVDLSALIIFGPNPPCWLWQSLQADAPLFHRVVGLFIPFGPYDPVAAPAKIGEGVLEVLGAAGVNAVAVVAGDILPAVASHVPGCQSFELFVAAEAAPRFLTCIRYPLPEGRNTNAFFALMFHVGCPRPVAGLASVMSGRVARHDLLAVDRGGIAFVSIGMAETADLGSHHPGRLRIVSRQDQDGSSEGDCEGGKKKMECLRPMVWLHAMQKKR